MNHYSSGRISRLLLPLLMAGSMLLTAQTSPPHTTASKVTIDPRAAGAPMETVAAAIDLSTAQTAQQTIGALYDHIFSAFIYRIPVRNVVASMRTPLVNLEIAYWQNTNKGVTEQNLVDALNNAVTTLGLRREYLTTLSQVRQVRLHVVHFSPVFIGTRFATKDSTGKRTMNPSMSPLQAVIIFNSLVDSKIAAKEFQVTPEAWEKALATRSHPRLSNGMLNPTWIDDDQAAVREYDKALSSLSDADKTQLWVSTLKYFGVN